LLGFSLTACIIILIIEFIVSFINKKNKNII
jgi:hypothetical protein